MSIAEKTESAPDFPVTADFAEWIAGLETDAIPETAFTWAKHALLDWFGVTIAGAREPLVDMMVEEFAPSDDGSCTLVGRGIHARLHEAALRLETGDTNGAVDIYRLVADDSGVPDAWRDLALLLAVLHSLDTGDPDALAADLRPLTDEDSAWRYNARELGGLLALRLGDVEEARQIFELLAADPFAPAGIRNRALELTGVAEGG